mmetsp:Transcript_1797/g.3879  ORF Transcript_1797/g.3879 Transcript_1797/m.3879 type:complete len:515 (-) Transcript_1797:589-2133(-)
MADLSNKNGGGSKSHQEPNSAPLSPRSRRKSAKATSSSSSAAAAAAANKKKCALSPQTVEYLKSWILHPAHIEHPYPTEEEKSKIMAETGIELKQLTNWFVNNRKRFWKPRVEAKLQQKYAVAAAAQVQGVTVPGISTGSAAPAAAAGSSASHLHHQQHHRLSITSNAPPATRSPEAAQPQSYAPAGYHALSQPTFQTLGAQPAAPPSPRQSAHHAVALPQAQGHHRQFYSSEDRNTVSETSASTCISDDDDSTDSSKFPHSTVGAAISGMNALRRQSSLLSTGAGNSATLRREEVDVHVLKPETCPSNGGSGNDVNDEELPTIRDLTIKTNVPKERILATFPKCQISYTVPVEIEHDRKKVQSRRDGEVLRVKKHYLKLYLATRGIHSVASPVGESGDVSSPWASTNSTIGKSEEPAYAHPTSTGATAATTDQAASNISALAEASSRVRTMPDSDQEKQHDDNNPRKKARTSTKNDANGEDAWRKACLNAKGVFCESLPGLEEAARMFGYGSE